MSINKISQIITKFFLFVLVFMFLSSILTISKRAYNQTQTIMTSLNNIFSVLNRFKLIRDFAQFDPLIKYKITGRIISNNVKAGKNDFLFYLNPQDGDLVNDYLGKNLPSETELVKLKNEYEFLEKYFSSLGAKVFFVFAPNKGEVYKNFMPSPYNSISETKSRHIVNFLVNNAKINIINPYDELCFYSKKYEVYYKKDTHWNMAGSYITYSKLLKNALKINLPTLDEVSLKTKIKTDDDIIKMLNLKGYIEPSIDYIFNNVNYQLMTSEQKDISFVNEKSPINKKVLLIGDSYRVAFAGHLNSSFSNLRVCDRHKITQDAVTSFKPDIVIVLSVSRYITEAAKNVATALKL